MSKLASLTVLAVLAATLVGACMPYEPYHSYGYRHAYWRHHGYWRHGYWNNGSFVNGYIYVDPDGALPAGVTVPQTDAAGNVIAPGMVAPNTGAGIVAAPGMVQPVAPAPGVIAQPNTAAGVAP